VVKEGRISYNQQSSPGYIWLLLGHFVKFVKQKVVKIWSVMKGLQYIFQDNLWIHLILTNWKKL